MINLIKEFARDIFSFQVMTTVKAMICSFLNIIIYIIFFFLIIGMAQSKVFTVALFMDSERFILAGNIVFFHAMLYFLAYLMSIYPTYIYFVLFSGDFDDSMDSKAEGKDNLVFKSEKIGLVYFGDRGGCSGDYCLKNFKGKSPDLSKLSTVESVVRKAMAAGIFLLWSWLLVFTYYYHQTQFIQGKTFWLIVLGIFSLGFVWVFWYVTIHCKRHVGLPLDFDVSNRQNRNSFLGKLINRYGGDDYSKYIPELTTYVKLRWILIFILLGVMVAVASIYGWSLTTVIIEFFISALLSIDLMIMRSFRKYIPKFNNFERPCDNLVFLGRIRRAFFSVLAFFILLNLSDFLAVSTNALVATLCGVIIFYYAATMLIKFYLLNKYSAKAHADRYNWSSFSYMVLVFGLSVFFTFNLVQGNRLHKLILLDKKEDPVNLTTYYDRFVESKSDTSSVFLYAAYGGGLKAHNWNLLVLDKLKENRVMDNVLSMSGVSGGGMGMTSHTILEYLEVKGVPMDRDTVQSYISSSNVLGLELAYYFGFDFIRNMLPDALVYGRNRSFRSMEFYDTYFGGYGLADEVSFDEVYKTIFDHKFYPNVIINSTSAINNYGVVSAVRDSMNIFPNGINLLDIKVEGRSKTLTFLEAASTCNRFPVISPAADVPTKGTFVDGGYYENSGIMSLLSFKEAIEEHEKSRGIDSINSIFRDTTKIISVTNYEGSYLYSLVRDSLLTEVSCNNNKQLNLVNNVDYPGVTAILSSITNLERNPSYYRAMLDRYHQGEYKVVHIDLPFYITDTQIESYYGGELDTGSMCLVKKLVEKSNRVILEILDNDPNYDLEKWGVINPPTSRMLSRPVEIYMTAMLDHPRVVKQLNISK